MRLDSNNITATFWRFVLPTTGALLVSGLYQVVDGLFIGNYIGSSGLTAINMVWPLVAFIAGIGLMLGIGSGALSSLEQGRKNDIKASKYISQYFWLLIALSIPSFLFLYYILDYALTFQNAEPIIKEMGAKYIHIISYCSFFTLSSISAPMIVRNLGAPFFATFSVIAGALTNIVLDYIFIVHFGWELRGAAIATVLGEILTTVMCFYYILSKRNPIRPVLKNCGFMLIHSYEILKLGLSSMVTYIYISVIVILYNTLFMRYGGTVYVAAFAIIGYFTSIFYFIVEGIAGGMQPLISYFYGARQIKNMNRVLYLACVTGVAIGLLFTASALLFPKQIVQFFTNEQDLYEIASYGMRIALSLLVIEAIGVIISVFFQSIGSAGKSIFISLMNAALKIPVIHIFAAKWGVNAIWAVAPFCNLILMTLAGYLLYMEFKRLKILRLEK